MLLGTCHCAALHSYSAASRRHPSCHPCSLSHCISSTISHPCQQQRQCPASKKESYAKTTASSCTNKATAPHWCRQYTVQARPHLASTPLLPKRSTPAPQPPVPMQRVLLQHSTAPAPHARRHSRLPLRRPYAASALHKLSPAPRCMPLSPSMPQHSTPSANTLPVFQPAARPTRHPKRRHYPPPITPPIRRLCALHYAAPPAFVTTS
jgi:hypothetical protein